MRRGSPPLPLPRATGMYCIRGTQAIRQAGFARTGPELLGTREHRSLLSGRNGTGPTHIHIRANWTHPKHPLSTIPSILGERDCAGVPARRAGREGSAEQLGRRMGGTRPIGLVLDGQF